MKQYLLNMTTLEKVVGVLIIVAILAIFKFSKKEAIKDEVDYSDTVKIIVLQDTIGNDTIILGDSIK